MRKFQYLSGQMFTCYRRKSMLLIPVHQLFSHPSGLICSVYQALLLSWEIQWLTCQRSGERPLEIFFFLREARTYSHRNLHTVHLPNTTHVLASIYFTLERREGSCHFKQSSEFFPLRSAGALCCDCTEMPFHYMYVLGIIDSFALLSIHSSTSTTL